MAESSISQIFTCHSLVHASSGGLGNAFAIIVCYPLECARTRLQVDDKLRTKPSLFIIKDVLSEEGVRGLYRGVTSLAFSLFTMSFIQFYIFHGLKAVLQAQHEQQHVLTDLLFGSVAGVVVTIVTNPLWVVNTRLKLQGAKLKSSVYKDLKHPRYNGILDCLVKIVQYEGILELWKGLFPSLVLVSNPGIQFMVYEGLKRLTQRVLGYSKLHGMFYLVFGAIGKMIATFATYPLQLLQTRTRAGYKGKEVFAAEDLSFSLRGFMALYRGLESKLMQTVFTAALMFFLYEVLAQYMFSFTSNTHGSMHANETNSVT